MANVKTAISLSAATFERVDALARELRVPRSRLFARAVEEYLDRHDTRALKAAIDRAYAEPESAAEKDWRRSTRRQHRRLVEGEW
jgi:predicted transcriptional regulator